MCWIRNKIINFVIRFKSWWYTIKWLGVNYTFLSTITITHFVSIWNVIKHRAHGKIQVHVNIMKSKHCRHLVFSLIEKKNHKNNVGSKQNDKILFRIHCLFSIYIAIVLQSDRRYSNERIYSQLVTKCWPITVPIIRYVYSNKYSWFYIVLYSHYINSGLG